MRLNKENLQMFMDKITGFKSISHTEKVICFGYYLQTYENREVFSAADIQNCYDTLDLARPENIHDTISKAKSKDRLLPRNGGYRISSDEYDRINQVIEQTQTVAGRLEKVYKPGDIYQLYDDVKAITTSAKSEVFIIDGYANEDVIDLYLSKLPTSVKMMILTNKYQGNFLNVAKKFKLRHPSNFAVKTNDKCHDRLFFVDKQCYVVGQSIDKAALDKPTYLIGVVNGGQFRNVFQKLFDNGKTLPLN